MKKIIIISILLISVTSCKIYTDVSYKMVCVYPCQDFDYYQFKYKNSRFSSLSSINHETFSPKLCFTEENSEDLSFNFIYIIDKSKLEEKNG